MKPTNQHELVIHTLWEFTYLPLAFSELTQAYWATTYKSLKFNTRLGEVERELNRTLVRREWRQFTNRFGHVSQYRVYVPVLSTSEYEAIFKEMQSKNN